MNKLFALFILLSLCSIIRVQGDQPNDFTQSVVPDNGNILIEGDTDIPVGLGPNLVNPDEPIKLGEITLPEMEIKTSSLSAEVIEPGIGEGIIIEIIVISANGEARQPTTNEEGAQPEEAEEEPEVGNVNNVELSVPESEINNAERPSDLDLDLNIEANVDCGSNFCDEGTAAHFKLTGVMEIQVIKDGQLRTITRNAQITG